MRTRDVSVRLEAHRLKFIHDGRRGPLLPFHELTESEKQFFIEELSKDVAVRRLNVSDPADERVFDRMLLGILNEWGVMCTHPKVSVEETPHGYRCDTCGCDLVPARVRKRPAKTGR